MYIVIHVNFSEDEERFVDGFWRQFPYAVASADPSSEPSESTSGNESTEQNMREGENTERPLERERSPLVSVAIKRC